MSVINTPAKAAATGLPVWLKTVTGLVVFGLLLSAILYGTGILSDGVSKDGRSKNGLPVDIRADSALDRGQWKIAADAYRQMLNEDQFDARSMFRIGYCLFMDKKYSEALPYLTSATEFARFKLFSMFIIARIHASEDRPDEAIQFLRSAIDGGFVTRDGIETIADLEVLRDDPIFDELALKERETRDRNNGH